MSAPSKCGSSAACFSQCYMLGFYHFICNGFAAEEQMRAAAQCQTLVQRANPAAQGGQQ